MPGGKPRIIASEIIDQKQFEELCKIQCTEEEIAAVCGCTVDMVLRFCMETYGCGFIEAAKRFRSAGKASLRRKQYRIAMESKNPTTMLIWLGKQYLGQTDKIEQETREKVEFIDDVKPDDNK